MSFVCLGEQKLIKSVSQSDLVKGNETPDPFDVVLSHGSNKNIVVLSWHLRHDSGQIETCDYKNHCSAVSSSNNILLILLATLIEFPERSLNQLLSHWRSCLQS